MTGTVSTLRPSPGSSERPEGAPGTLNEVHLLGRLADVPLERELPSGDLLVTFRLVVDRPPERRPTRGDGPVRRTPTVDTLDCVAWRARERKRLLGYESGCSLEVWGSLRRRFYRGPGGLGSRYEVLVERVGRA